MTRFNMPLFVVFFIFLVFPWVKFVPFFPTDIQPFSFFMGLLILLTLLVAVKFKVKSSVSTSILFLLSCLSLLIFLQILVIDGVTFDTLRGGYQYLYASLFFLLLILFISNNFSNKHAKTIKYLVHITFFIWFFVGLVQRLYDGEFLTSVLSRAVVTEDRGAISLSSEPAYFAVVLLFYSITFYLFGNTKLSFFSVLMIPVLTHSSVGVLVAMTVLMLFYFLKSKHKVLGTLISLGLVFGLVFFTSIFYSDSDSRLAYLLNAALNDSASLVSDGSLNIRLSHFYYSHLGFFDSFLPHGVLIWPNYIDSMIGEPYFLFDSGTQQTSRINSGIGGVLFEAGFLGLGLLFLVIYLLKELAFNFKEFILISFVFIVLFYTGWTFKTPFFYLLLYFLLLRKHISGNALVDKEIL